MKTTIGCRPPDVSQMFDPELLSRPMLYYSVDRLKPIFDFLEIKLKERQFNKFPNTRLKLEQKLKYFMELYHHAKEKEKESERKTPRQTQMFGYRPRLSNKNDRAIFERLRARVRSVQK